MHLSANRVAGSRSLGAQSSTGQCWNLTQSIPRPQAPSGEATGGWSPRRCVRHPAMESRSFCWTHRPGSLAMSPAAM